MTDAVRISRHLVLPWAATGALCLCLAGTARADDGELVLDNQWHGNVVVGGSYSSGNTDSTTISATADLTKASVKDTIRFGALANYGSTETSDSPRTTTANQAWLRGRYDYNLSTKVFAFGGADVETNKLGGIDLRYGLSAGAGYWLMRNDINTFNVFAGASYSDVQYTDDISSNGLQLLLGEESDHKLGAGTTLKQRLVYRPQAGDLGNVANFDAALATTIVGNWTLNLGLNVQYNGVVPPGVEKTDTLLTVGFGYKF